MIKDSPEVVSIRQEFDAFYEKNLKHLFLEMEKSRKKYKRSFVLSAIAIFVLLPLTMLWQLDNIINFFNTHASPEDAEFFFYVYLALTGILVVPIKAYKKKNKKVIMPEFIKFFEGFSFFSGHGVLDEDIEKSMLFGKYNKKEPDDYFSGVYKGVNVAISEEKLVRETYNAKGDRRSYNIFKGVFIELSMNKEFECKTVGKKDKGFLNKINSCRGLENIKLEDVVFEKEWEIYSDNQVEARYLLTTAFMERLLKVKEMYKSSRLQFSFFDNVLFIAIDMRGDLFETSSLFRSTFDRKHINETLEQFLSVLAIVDILKLNQNKNRSI